MVSLFCVSDNPRLDLVASSAEETQVGIFPANFVRSTDDLARTCPPPDPRRPFEIKYEELEISEVIGIGGFGKVYR